jgi:hypothetical protein
MFKTPLDVRMLPESDATRWMLLSPLVYDSPLAGMITVPTGFITDFVSFEPLKDLGQRPAVVHDYLYTTGTVPRETADEVLLEALQSVGVDDALARAMFDAVRLFGASHFKKGD